MPNGNPLAGEVWETTDPTGRVVRGVVADITSTIVTLVSFTGNRFRLPPHSLTSSWRFSQAPPSTALHCSRRGCTHAGILRFARGANAEWVCPRHLPVGIQASLTTESIGSPRATPPPLPTITINAPLDDPHCTGCGNRDPVEDSRVILPPNTSLWICHRCPERWCWISMPNTVVSSYDSHTALLDTLNAVRVALSVENYFIREISTSGTYYGLFEAEVARQIPEVNGERARLESPGMVVYAGLPIRNSFTFRADNPSLTLMRLQLGGGPELRVGRPLPRDPVQPLPPDVVGLAQLQQTAGPTYPGVFTAPVGGPAPSGYISGRETYSIGLSRVSPADPSELLAAMHSTPFVSKGTRWSNRSNGEIVEVTQLGRSTDTGDTVVHFKRISDDLEAGAILLQLDFATLYKPVDVEPHTLTKLHGESVVEVLKDQEWEHIDTGETGVVDTVDTKRNLVIIIGKDKHRRSVRMLDFVNNKWRKIMRRTAYARLLEDDD